MLLIISGPFLEYKSTCMRSLKKKKTGFGVVVVEDIIKSVVLLFERVGSFVSFFLDALS